MRVRSVQLEQFRCHAAWSAAVPEGADLIGLTGPNGSGKTSILEALAQLAPGRGLLGHEAASHLPPKAGHWAVHVALADGTAVGQRFQKSGRGAQRQILLDGTAVPQHALAGIGALLALTPQTDFLFSGPPEARRNWLDDAVSAWQPAHAEAVARYRQHRQGRLKILAQGVLAGDWLAAEEHLCAQWGIAVLQGRVAYLAAVQQFLETLTFALEGQAAMVQSEPDPVAALAGKLERSREIDARMGRTHAGPNTLNLGGTLKLSHGDVPLGQASAGQHKRALLHWLGAQARLLTQTRKAAPLVLIDEFTAHLDEAARCALLADLRHLGCQIWLADVQLPAQDSLLRIEMPAPATIHL